MEFIPQFFENNDFFIDEKVNMFKFTNTYRVFNSSGVQIGVIQETKSGWHKFVSLLVNKSMMPFHLYILDTGNNTLASIHRGWTFFMSKITVRDTAGNTIASINQKFKFFKPTFRFFDSQNHQFAVITGDWKAWNFTITDNSGRQIGVITKKWAGAMKEFFTSADKYLVSIEPDVAEDVQKVAIVSAAITVDMVLKESH